MGEGLPSSILTWHMMREGEMERDGMERDGESAKEKKKKKKKRKRGTSKASGKYNLYESDINIDKIIDSQIRREILQKYRDKTSHII